MSTADLTGLIRRLRNACCISSRFHHFVSFFALFLAPVIWSFSATLAGLAFISSRQDREMAFYYVFAEERSK